MSSPSTPNAPDPAQTYKEGIQIYLKYLPEMLQAEQNARNQYDPQRILQQQQLQAAYGPSQYGEQLSALSTLDPTGYALRNLLGGAISSDLGLGGVDARASEAYRQLGDRINTAVQQGYLNPQQAAAYNSLGNFTQQALAQGALTPEQAAAYKALGQTVAGQLAMGTQQSPEALRQEQQAIRAGQAARGNILGNAPISAEALYQGQRGQQLYQQRVGNVQNYLGLQNPAAAAAQLGLGYSQLAPPEAAALQAGLNYYGLQSPEEKTFAQSGSFLSLPTPESQINQIQGVTPDRASAYVNPQAGYQGQQFGLQNFQNQLAGAGGATNPWSSALGTVGGITGSIAGAYFGAGNPAATYGGGALGSTAGNYIGSLFSDALVKQNITEVGRTKEGIPLVEFSYTNDPKRRFRGVIAQDVLKVRPDAVFSLNGILGVHYDKLGLALKEV